jgi:hypothetical protein
MFYHGKQSCCHENRLAMSLTFSRPKVVCINEAYCSETLVNRTKPGPSLEVAICMLQIYGAIESNYLTLNLKTLHKQRLGSLPLDMALPALGGKFLCWHCVCGEIRYFGTAYL